MFRVARTHTYKVCFKPKTLPWFQVLQTPVWSNLVFPLWGSTDKVVAGATTHDGSLHRRTRRGPAWRQGRCRCLAELQNSPGTHRRRHCLGAQCDTSTAETSGYSLTVESTQATFELQFQMPMTAGTYVFCYQRSSVDNRWYQPPGGTGTTHDNPFVVVKSDIGFRVPDGAAAGDTTVIWEVADANVNITGWANAALAAADKIRLYAPNEVCSVNVTADHVLDYMDNTATNTLVNDATSILGKRFTTPPGFAFWCVAAAAEQRLRARRRIQLILDLIATPPANLQVRSCPPYNMTRRTTCARGTRSRSPLCSSTTTATSCHSAASP